jgi:hypothetical protein
MFKSTKTKVVALALVGMVALGAATYVTTALANGGASAAPVTAATTTQTTLDPQLRAGILEMLKDRMGLTGADAEKFADQMIARMQSINPNFDLQAMLNWCNQFIGANASGRGMMGAGNATCPGWNATGGNGSTYRGGMMGNSTYRGGMMGGWGVN